MKKLLTAPITYEQISDLKIGDIVYYSGVAVTARDEGHKRVVEHGILPQKVSLNGAALLHVGPIIKGDADAGYQAVAAGPTTSRRMDSHERQFIERTGVKLIVGKGGMGPKTAAACSEFKALHCVYPGGCGVSAAVSVESVMGVEWEDLGMPEALWIFKMKEFGPLIVSIDTHGDNLFEKNKAIFEERKVGVLDEAIKALKHQ